MHNQRPAISPSQTPFLASVAAVLPAAVTSQPMNRLGRDMSHTVAPLWTVFLQTHEGGRDVESTAHVHPCVSSDVTKAPATAGNDVSGVDLGIRSAALPNQTRREGRMAQGRPTPLTAQTIDRLVDLRVALHAIFGADGQVDHVETETLLLLEHAQQTAEQADWARRARNVVEETGELTPTLLRRHREIQRDYQHLQAA